MRTKTIIDGFKNSQKFRVIFKGDGSENDIGMYMTVQQMILIYQVSLVHIFHLHLLNQPFYCCLFHIIFI